MNAPTGSRARWRPEPLVVTAMLVRDALGAGNEVRARLLLFQFVNDWRSADPDDQPGLVAEEPESTGQLRYDAFVAALAEYLCAISDISIPTWTTKRGRFAKPFFFLSPVRTLWDRDLVDSPISFSRHGVFIPRDSLEGV